MVSTLPLDIGVNKLLQGWQNDFHVTWTNMFGEQLLMLIRRNTALWRLQASVAV